MTIEQRAAGLNEAVKVSVTLTMGTLLRVEGIARQLGISRAEAIAEAVGDWMLRWEGRIDKRAQREIAASLQETMQNAESAKKVSDALARTPIAMEQPTITAKEVGILVRVQSETHDALKALADREHRSMAGQLRFIIEQAVRGSE